MFWENIFKYKWTNEAVDTGVVETLLQRSQLFSSTEKHYFIFAKTGFTKGCIAKAREIGNVKRSYLRGNDRGQGLIEPVDLFRISFRQYYRSALKHWLNRGIATRNTLTLPAKSVIEIVLISSRLVREVSSRLVGTCFTSGS